MVSNFFRSVWIPCSLYIDDRHNGQLQISPRRGAYAAFVNSDEHNLAATKSASLFGSLLLDQTWVLPGFVEIDFDATLTCSILGLPVRFFSGGFPSYS